MLVAVSALAFQVQRAQLSEVILSKVDGLALTPPLDQTELEWAVHVYGTHNLHCAAMPQVRASYTELRQLNRYLDTAISTGPDAGTIATLWDTYAELSDSGARYREKYESRRNSDAHNGDGGLRKRGQSQLPRHARFCSPNAAQTLTHARFLSTFFWVTDLAETASPRIG